MVGSDDMTPEEWHALDFPYKDDLGFIWVDPDGFIDDSREGKCFICKQPTRRVDISYEGHYCGSTECEEEIRKDLENAKNP